MAYGKYAPKLVDQFNILVLMVLSLLIFPLPIGATIMITFVDF